MIEAIRLFSTVIPLTLIFGLLFIFLKCWEWSIFPRFADAEINMLWSFEGFAFKAKENKSGDKQPHEGW